MMLLLLAGGRFFAGLVDAIAGGGGLLSLPALLATGIDPVVALGTNKMQAIVGTTSATRQYAKAGQVDIPALVPFGIIALIFSAGGALSAKIVGGGPLMYLVIAVLVILFFWTLLNPGLGSIAKPPKLSKKTFFRAASPVIGSYDGFLGPGTGSFWMAACVYFRGHDMRRAAGHAKWMNLCSNIGALGMFIYLGLYRLDYAAAMAGGQIVGATLGAKLAVTKGARLIRPFFLIAVAATLVKLVYTNMF